jgi:hypothetical protein
LARTQRTYADAIAIAIAIAIAVRAWKQIASSEKRERERELCMVHNLKQLLRSPGMSSLYTLLLRSRATKNPNRFLLDYQHYL